jgi:2-polyprenyl-6-methoxyphenol hydroxylase-like FAD-dependent oxidoreductase
MKPFSDELADVLAELLQASSDVRNDPADFGPYTESCRERLKKAEQRARSVLKLYRRTK